MVVAATPFILGLGTASSLPACSQLWGGAWELVSLGMEVRAWDGSHLPPPTPSLVPTSSPAPPPRARLGCSAMLHGGEAFCATIPPLRPCGGHNTLVKYLGVSLNPSISGHSSRHKVNFAVCQTWCPQNAAVPWHVEGKLHPGHPQVTPPVSLPLAWEDPAG